MATKIEWADMTWNPITGCTRVSPGCENCYAERLSKRLSAMGQEKYDRVTRPEGGWSGQVRLHWEMLAEPRLPKSPKRIFVGSMSDWFHPEVPTRFIDKLLEVFENHPQHTFMTLTKRPELAHEKLYSVTEDHGSRFFGGGDYLENLWLGTSVESPDYLHRLYPFLNFPAAERFISYEPALDEPRFAGWIGLWKREFYAYKWLICGGESGPGARPMEHDWVREARDQAKEAGAAFFFKQWSSANPGPVCPETSLPVIDGHTWAEFPDEVRTSPEGKELA